MDPKKTAQLVERYVKKLLPKGTEYTLSVIDSSKAYLTAPTGDIFEKLKQSFVIGFGTEPALVPSGGSIGLVTVLSERFGTTSLLASYGLPDDRLHGPNEKYNLSQFRGGFATFCEFLK
jgi:acetylornithine deacetylase/succinyl-diaminopimelate desuccinylase-like protein